MDDLDHIHQSSPQLESLALPGRRKRTPHPVHSHLGDVTVFESRTVRGLDERERYFMWLGRECSTSCQNMYSGQISGD